MNQCTAVMAGSVSSQGFLITDTMGNMAAPGAPHQLQVNNQNYQAVWRRRHRQQGERSGDGEGRDGPAMDGVPAAVPAAIGGAVAPVGMGGAAAPAAMGGAAAPAAMGGAAAPAAMGGAAAPAAMGGAVAMGGTEAMGGRTTGNDFETWKSDVLHAGTEAAKATWLYICCYEQCSLHIRC